MTFDSGSKGQLAMVIYEWGDVAYLGKETTSRTGSKLPVSMHSLSHVHRLKACYIAEYLCLHLRCDEERLLR